VRPAFLLPTVLHAVLQLPCLRLPSFTPGLHPIYTILHEPYTRLYISVTQLYTSYTRFTPGLHEALHGTSCVTKSLTEGRASAMKGRKSSELSCMWHEQMTLL
jgi:hypothetical protein